jgi:hypothetical protein
MASGHASRINRPNTWLLRPNLRREESPCQHGAVHTWHSFTVGSGRLVRLSSETDYTGGIMAVPARTITLNEVRPMDDDQFPPMPEQI